MALGEKFQFEELDSQSREYLLHAKEHHGRGMPGIFVPKSNSLPVIGCVFGIVVLGLFAFLAADNMTKRPWAVAMLETAGLMLGGWLIVAALRVWKAAGSSRFVGHFLYADSETLWDCSGFNLTALDLGNLVEASGVHNYKEGKYQNTAVTVKMLNGANNLSIGNEEHARRLIVFLNMLVWMRSQANAPAAGEEAEGQINFKDLPLVVLGGLAKQLAMHGEFPANFSAQTLEIEVESIPLPRKEGVASSGFMNYLIITAIAAACFLIFSELNVEWRDDAIWENITSIGNPDQRVVWLRAYLSDTRNTHHRDEAKRMLVDIYKNNIARMKNLAPAGPGKMFPGVPFPGPQPVKVDNDFLDGFAEVLMAIAEKPQGVISVSVKESPGDGNPIQKPQREDEVRNKYTLKLYEGIGKDLAFFVRPPDDVPGLIDIDYKLVRQPGGFGNRCSVVFTVKFRKNPDDDPVKTASMTISTPNDLPGDIGKAAEELGLRTAGQKKPEPQQPPGDI